MPQFSRPSGVARFAFACVAVLVCASAASAQWPNPPVPPENPITEPKRILGKILFWDEQMSSDNTMSCGTCHSMTRGGTDTRRSRHPGADQMFFTADDPFGSPGVMRSGPDGKYLPHNLFALNVQVTRRGAPPVINAAFGELLFHDGRAGPGFTDPQTGLPVMTSGGALESQIVNPPVAADEMGHDFRNWGDVISKLQVAKPLALATALTADQAAAIAANPTYPQLFNAAFGDPAITSVRIAFAIATYERTLISDQSPYDDYVAGNLTALTPTQIEGMNLFDQVACSACHFPDLFTDNTFHYIGIRPKTDDLGRAEVTLDPLDNGKFKSVNLRNVGLKTTYMHNGMFSTLLNTIKFYKNGPHFDNALDEPVLGFVFDAMNNLNGNSGFPTDGPEKIEQFLKYGLTDPRVEAGTFPFDSPTLWSLRPEHKPVIIPGGQLGSGFYTPSIIAITPPMLGNPNFKIGVQRGLGGAPAQLNMSASPPVNGRIPATYVLGTTNLSGSGDGQGYGTVIWPVPNNGILAGQTRYFQWVITDPGGPGGEAFTPVVAVTFFCPYNSECPPACPADLDDGNGLGTADGSVDINDLLYFLNQYEAGYLPADVDEDGLDPAAPDGAVDLNDLLFFLYRFEVGC